jgi:hypothetical protein
MKESFGPRKTVSNPSKTQHLNRFAIAIILAGMCLLALPAGAKIVYAKVNVKIGRGGAQSHNINLDNTGATLTIQFKTGTTFCSAGCQMPLVVFDQFIVSPASGNGIEGSPPAALTHGAPIGAAQVFYGGNGTMSYFHGGTGFPCVCPQFHYGNFFYFQTTTRFLGVAFQKNGQTHYGWASFTGNLWTAILTGYAYETTPGQSINAGRTSGAEDNPSVSPDSANSEDSVPVASATNPTQAVSPGMLALGARETPWRRRKVLLDLL